MSKLKWKLDRLKIAHKISAAIFLFILCPAVLLPSLIFNEMKNQDINNRIKNMQSELNQYRSWMTEGLEAGYSEDEVILDLITSEGGTFVFYLDKDGVPYYPKRTGIRPYRLEDILKALDSVLWDIGCIQTELGGVQVIVGVLVEEGFDGVLIRVESLEQMYETFKDQKNRYTVSMLMFSIVGFLMINAAVHQILKRFYRVVGTVHEMQRGNLEADVPSCGADEIGELAGQLNIMRGVSRS